MKPAFAADEAPDVLVKRLSTEVLDTIKADSSIKAGDVNKIMVLVDTKIMPNVNFQRMTASAVGPAWRQATPEQRQRLMDEFRAMLLRTYSGAMSAVGDQTIRMKPLRAEPDAKDLIVRSEIVQPGREPIQLDYRMQKTDSGWKIYDLNVLGVWIVETYRNQFNQEAQRGGGVEGLIRSLADKNREFGPKKAS